MRASSAMLKVTLVHLQTSQGKFPHGFEALFPVRVQVDFATHGKQTECTRVRTSCDRETSRSPKYAVLGLVVSFFGVWIEVDQRAVHVDLSSRKRGTRCVCNNFHAHLKLSSLAGDLSSRKAARRFPTSITEDCPNGSFLVRHSRTYSATDTCWRRDLLAADSGEQQLSRDSAVATHRMSTAKVARDSADTRLCSDPPLPPLPPPLPHAPHGHRGSTCAHLCSVHATTPRLSVVSLTHARHVHAQRDRRVDLTCLRCFFLKFFFFG